VAAAGSGCCVATTWCSRRLVSRRRGCLKSPPQCGRLVGDERDAGTGSGRPVSRMWVAKLRRRDVLQERMRLHGRIWQRGELDEEPPVEEEGLALCLLPIHDAVSCRPRDREAYAGGAWVRRGWWGYAWNHIAHVCTSSSRGPRDCSGWRLWGVLPATPVRRRAPDGADPNKAWRFSAGG
jgi:hypothetical protein